MDIVIGAYYELPDGRIARTIGYNGVDKVISFATDPPYKRGECLASTCKNWKKRDDLRDFPNASDPRLPYEFDLNYDIKTMRQLCYELSGEGSCDSEEIEELRELIKKYNINL